MKAVLAAAATALMALCAAAARVSPAEISPHLRELLQARQFAEAEQIVSAQLTASPGWETGHLLLSQIYSQTGKYDLAERSATAALRLRESLDAYMLLAAAAQHLNRLNDSIAWLEKAARLNPEHAEIYQVLGIDYALGGALGEAEKWFHRAVELAPANWECRYLLGRTLFELGRFEDARPMLEAAVKSNPTSVKAWTALGQVQERTGADSAGQASYGKAVELCGQGPDCAWPLLQIGYRYAQQNRFAQALPFFRRAVEARPAWARTHFQLAKALAELNDLAAARQQLEQAVSLDGGKSEYHYQLSRVCRKLGDTARARAEMALFRAASQQEHGTADTSDFTQP